MNPIDRRDFLKRAALAAGAGLLGPAPRSAAAGVTPGRASDAVRLGLIGLGSKGRHHLGLLATRGDARVVALCDVDPENLARAVREAADHALKPFATTDARKLLARADVDAVVIATGNHWHALLAVWACQAGKDVYVEKPMTRTVWEGRKLIEAATKYGRIVQAGTQYRSETGLAGGIEFIRSGQLGKLRHVHAVYYGLRGPVARRNPWYPDWLDYDTFCGPTPVVPLERERLHYDWHWSWATGNGELGNNGVHLLDIALRMVGAEAPPPRVLSLGGRFVHDDAAETPNAQIAVYAFPAAPVVFECRGLPARPGVSFMDQTGNIRVGVVAHCEGGYVSGLTGCTAYDHGGKIIRRFAGDGGAGHMTNFLDATRSRRAQDLAAPVAVGHASASCCHYGNISLRIGAPAAPETADAALEPVPAALEIGRSMQRHLTAHGIDLAKQRLVIGRWLELDPTRDGVARVESGKEADLDRARHLLHETQRPPYVIPERV